MVYGARPIDRTETQVRFEPRLTRSARFSLMLAEDGRYSRWFRGPFARLRALSFIMLPGFGPRVFERDYGSRRDGM